MTFFPTYEPIRKKISRVNMLDSLSRFSDYGTMLEIRDIQYFPDGRAVVDCVGSRRFKVSTIYQQSIVEYCQKAGSRGRLLNANIFFFHRC